MQIEDHPDRDVRPDHRVHGVSATARGKIEAAGGTVELLRPPKELKKKHHKVGVDKGSEVDGSDQVASGDLVADVEVETQE